MKVICYFPNGSINNYDSLPRIKDLDEKYAKYEWEFMGTNPVGMKQYKLVTYPAFNITFMGCENGPITLSSDSITDDNLPRPIHRDGYTCSWNIPAISKTDIEITPDYTPIEYCATFIDEAGLRSFKFTLDKPCLIPEPRKKSNYVGIWEPFEFEARDITVKASYKPVKITFEYDGIVSEQLFEQLSPPTLTQNEPNCERYWSIPHGPLFKDVTLTPSLKPITHHIYCHISEEYVEKCPFNVKYSPELPPVPKRRGYVSEWSPFDAELLQDQEVHPLFRPIKITLHMLDGTTITHEYNEDNPPQLEPIEGMIWPKYTALFEDIDLYPIPETLFALFFVNKELRFIVPYNVFDHHYIEEMLTKNTVPEYRRSYGTWVEVEPYMGMRSFCADYSIPQPNVPRDKLSFEWNLEKIADYLYDHEKTIKLNDVSIPLLSTTFSDMTGITEKNLQDYRSLYLRQWLEREGIPYIDNVSKYKIGERTNGTLELSLYGNFLIGYKREFDDALSFLEQYDIFFEDFKKTAKYCDGLPAKHLPYKVLINDDSREEIEKAWRGLYPVNIKIPSRKPINKIVYKGNEKPKVELVNIKKAMTGNLEVIKTYNTRYCPECEFEIVEGNEPAVILKQYNGSLFEYDVPMYVSLDGSDASRYLIVEIGDYAFMHKELLKSITLPKSIKTIGKRAFFGCKHITNIELPEDLEIINDQAFNGCRLKSITIPPSVRHIGHRCFSNIDSIILECKPDALLEDSVPSLCQIIQQSSTDDDNREELPDATEATGMSALIDALKPYQYDYLIGILQNKDVKSILTSVGKRASTVEMEINNLLSKYLDDDDGLVNDGVITEDYVEELETLMNN